MAKHQSSAGGKIPDAKALGKAAAKLSPAAKRTAAQTLKSAALRPAPKGR